jgi:hypothetical protein
MRYWTGTGPLPDGHPDPTQQGLEADPMLVCRQKLHAGVWEGNGYFIEERAELLLNRSCAAGSACTCCGQGNCWLYLSRCK